LRVSAAPFFVEKSRGEQNGGQKRGRLEINYHRLEVVGFAWRTKNPVTPAG